MKSSTQHMDDLLVKHLTGEASSAEVMEVEKWLTEDEANRHYFDHFRLIWEESVQLADATQVDENAAWQRFQNRVESGSFNQSNSGVISMNNPLLRAAVIAGLVIGLAALTFFLFQNKPGKVLAMSNIRTNEAVKTDSLPDGSTVILNKHSQVSFPEKFNDDKRVLQLSGEAFFKVTPDKKKPFEVHTNQVTITVVGTSFNVRSRSDTTEIIVETGVVEVSIDKQTVVLTPGQKAFAVSGTAFLQKQTNTDQLYNYYRSKKFVCENTPLWKLVDKLNEAYDVQISFGNAALRNLPLTTTFDNEPLDKILHLLSSTFNISVVKEKGQIILR